MKCRARKGHMTLLLCHSEPFDFAQDRLRRGISVLDLIARDLIRSLPARSTAGLPVYVTASPAAPFSTPLRFAGNDKLLVQIDQQRQMRFRYFQSSLGPAPRRPYHHAMRRRIVLIASRCARKSGGRVRPPLLNLGTIAATATSKASFIFDRTTVRL